MLAPPSSLAPEPLIVLHCPHDLPHSALLSPRFVGQQKYRVSAPDPFVSQSRCGTTSFRLEDDAYVHSLDLAHLQQSETQLDASDMALPVEPSCVVGKPAAPLCVCGTEPLSAFVGL